MKQLKLIIPEYKEDAIDLSQIDTEFKGIIMAIKNDQTVGSIVFNNSCEDWNFINNINADDYTRSDCSLVNLILNLLQTNMCDSFTVIKFE